MKRPTQNLEKHLATQLSFLQRSADSYDDGFTDEYIRLAQTLRVLFHNTRASHGLLDQTETEFQIFDTSGPFTPKNLVTNTALLKTGVGVASHLLFAPLSSAVRKNRIPVDNWWKQIVLIGQGIKYSRRDIILTVANKEGGSHVDPNLTSDFVRIERTGLGLFLVKGLAELCVPDNIISATIRQIGHEVLESLLDNYDKKANTSKFYFSTSGVAITFGDSEAKISRNQPCPCESGLKYKKCHGRL